MWGNHYHTVIVQVAGVSNALEVPMTLTAGNALYTDPVPAGGVNPSSGCCVQDMAALAGLTLH